MARVNGLYGYIRRNDLRALAMFGGFLVAFQIAGLMALFMPLMVSDLDHAPYPNPLGYLARYVPGLLVLGGGLFIYRFLNSSQTVRAQVAFRPIDQRAEPRWFNAVQTQAIALGLPPLQAGLLDSPARNAFAFGLTPASAVMVATRGLIDALDDEELDAVAALQAVQIRNGDIRLVAAANVLLGTVQWMRKQNNVRITGPRQILLAVLIPPMLLVFLAVWFAIRLAMLLARVSRLLIAASRQFAADAEAVRAVQNPAALISALRRIDGRSHVDGLAPFADAMLLDGATAGAYASHPPIEERIARLVALTGDLATERRPRRDTRPMHLVMTHRPATFGRAGDTDAASAVRAGLAARANLGVDDESFGLTPLLGAALGLGLCGVIVAKLVFGADTGSILGYLRADGLRANISDMIATSNGTGGFLARNREDPILPRHAVPSPAQGRCYTGDYVVGDNGITPFHIPDPSLVRMFTEHPESRGSDMVMERALALRYVSIQQIRNYRSGELDARLLDYVATRKAAIAKVHRHYGRPGLDYIRSAYASAEDGEVLDMLRQRFQAHVPGLVSDADTAADIALLLAAPSGFLPCETVADLR